MDQSARRGGIEVGGNGRSFQVRIASSPDEFERAFLLLAEKYRARGYEQGETKLFRFTPFHVLPETITVVAMDGERVAATLSMVPDTSLLGLPMESIYPEEVARLRREGRRLAEVTSLAEDGLEYREFLRVFEAMIRLVQQHHLRAGGDSWVITVNPRHGAFYRKVMGVVPIGDRRSHPSVNGAPAEAYLSDLAIMEANAPRTFVRIFGEPLPEAVLDAPSRPADHVAFFGEHSTAADRRTIREIAGAVMRDGCPPRWLESTAADRAGGSMTLRIDPAHGRMTGPVGSRADLATVALGSRNEYLEGVNPLCSV